MEAIIKSIKIYEEEIAKLEKKQYKTADDRAEIIFMKGQLNILDNMLYDEYSATM